jgi:hypothetical protein
MSSEVTMRTWREKFQALAMAVTFAEAGEWETAKSFVRTHDLPRVSVTADLKKRLDRRARKQAYRT